MKKNQEKNNINLFSAYLIDFDEQAKVKGGTDGDGDGIIIEELVIQ